MADQVKQFVSVFNSHLLKYDREFHLEQSPLLNLIYEKVGGDSGPIKRIHIVLGSVIIGLIVTLATLGWAFVSNFIGFAYPVYQSFKAIRSPVAQDEAHWLTYWVVYATFSLFESSIDLIFFWVPFYFLAKIVFLVWCFHPSTKGAQVVYDKILHPLFDKLLAISEQVEGEVTGAPAANNSTATGKKGKQRYVD